MAKGKKSKDRKGKMKVGRRLEMPRDPTSGDIIYRRGGEERSPAALPFVRALARDLARNNAYAARAVSVLTSHHIGKGIRISIKGDEEFAAHLNRWARSSSCDYEGRLDFYGIQSVATRAMFEAGDGFIVMRETDIKGRSHLTLQVLDPDQLDESAHTTVKDNIVIGGIELDRQGRVVGYHFREFLDDGIRMGMARSIFFAARDVIHLFEMLYPGQIRGIPRGSQALSSIRMHDDFIRAALQKARLEACITGVVITPEGTDDDGGLIGAAEDEGPRYMGANVATDGGSQRLLPTESVSPNTLVSLPMGSDFRQITTPSVTGFYEHSKITLEAASVAFGVTRSQISGNTDGLNFSTEKAEKIEQDRNVQTTRAHFLFPGFTRIAERSLEIFEANELREIVVDIHMTPPARETMQPLEEGNADMMHLLAGGKSWSEYIRGRGLDPETQIEEIKRDQQALADAGIIVQFGAVPIIQQIIAAADTDPSGEIVRSSSHAPTAPGKMSATQGKSA